MASVCGGRRDCAACVKSLAASGGDSHFPSRVIAIGRTSYFFRSIASITEAAERIETSCSLDLPPKITPTRSLFAKINIPAFLENSLTKGRQDQLNAQLGGLVINIQSRVDFNYFE
jgi:hypothetical protein